MICYKTLRKTSLSTYINDFLLGTLIAITVLFFGLFMASGFSIQINQVKLSEQLLLLSIILAGAIFEELVFRYFLFRYLTEITKSIWLALLLSSIVFAFLHVGNPNVTFLAVFSHFIGGIVYTSAYLLSKKLALPIGLHLGWNYAQVMLSLPMSGRLDEGWFTIPTLIDSQGYGGLYGIEGGWISILFRGLILIMVMLVFFKALRDTIRLKLRFNANH